MSRDYSAITNMSQGGDFFGSIMAGFLLGFGADWIFDTRPVFIVIGIVAGSVSGFFTMYRTSKNMENPNV